MKKIHSVAVVGAGTMGSALAQKFSMEGFDVILADRDMDFVNKGLSGIRQVLQDGVEKKVFTSDEAAHYLSGIKGTDNLFELKHCDLVIEAIYEDFQAKSHLFTQLSGIVSEPTILATNTSSFSVTELARYVANPAHFIGLHFFYHAAKNRLVEIIPGTKTSAKTVHLIQRFALEAGKDPIFTHDAYGFAVNRFFVPWLNEAVRLLSEHLADAGTIDNVCMRTFGIGMGPFALMNATGIPIAMHAQKTLELFGPGYQTSPALIKQAELKQNWTIGSTNESVPEPIQTRISERMLGSVFFVCAQILDEKVCSALDLNKGARIGLKWKKGPIDLMMQYGEQEVTRLVKAYCALYKAQVPRGISAKSWAMEQVSLSRSKHRAIITLNRPEDLNALNETIIKQLEEKFTIAEQDPAIDTILITGTGKAFVAGADIRFFVKNMKNHTLDNIVNFTKYGQAVFDKIDKSRKRVIAVLNGLALGGGLELALCADQILVLPKVKLAFPETGIGIYPGLGGTQRTAARVGKGLAKHLVLSGRSLSAEEALETGLIDTIISRDEMFELLDGGPIPEYRKPSRSEKWLAYSDLYQKNSIDAILQGTCTEGALGKEELEKLRRTLSYKAPVALHFAESLIEEARGPSSELDKLVAVFSTEDALLGLSSNGQKVAYQGK
ncbi:MAG TPA: 3-hydroxyacyl-CoA dehydrogenase/enoyl-CoA hydratase family protein [Bacteroidia bacterium]|nr:3-hydroxyacyl-CoA dehydrogenase/enoyl-CoA hydratase family protein [Bacteroidia bacterium]